MSVTIEKDIIYLRNMVFKHTDLCNLVERKSNWEIFINADSNFWMINKLRTKINCTLVSDIHMDKINEKHETSLAMESKPDEDQNREKLNYENDWKHVAKILDRFFFWILFLAIIVSLIIFLYPVMFHK